jgi:hypothetical protein
MRVNSLIFGIGRARASTRTHTHTHTHTKKGKFFILCGYWECFVDAAGTLLVFTNLITCYSFTRYGRYHRARRYSILL